MSTPITISRAQSWEFDWTVRQRNAATGDREPIDAASVVRAWLSATFKGDPITPASIVTLTRRSLALRTDGRPQWCGVLDAASVTEALAGIATGDQVAEVLEVDGERNACWLTVDD